MQGVAGDMRVNLGDALLHGQGHGGLQGSWQEVERGMNIVVQASRSSRQRRRVGTAAQAGVGADDPTLTFHALPSLLYDWSLITYLPLTVWRSN